MYPAGRQETPRASRGLFHGGRLVPKDQQGKEQTLPATQGEKEKPAKPDKDSKAQNTADRP